MNKNILMSSGILATIGSTICCWGPALLAGVAGLTGTASYFSWLHPLKPYLAGIAFVSLCFAFYQVYRKKNTDNSGCQYCVAEQKKKSRITKTILWGVTAFAIISFSYPYYNNLPTDHLNVTSKKQQAMIHTPDNTEEEKEVKLKVTGMSCTGCSSRCQKVLFDFNGVIDADVSYEKSSAKIRYNSDSTNVDEIIQRINKLGFKAKRMEEKEEN
ncbi:MAG: mercuric transporter MerT family protein [Flavobacteriales bacterium]